jgi:hypothetical protein
VDLDAEQSGKLGLADRDRKGAVGVCRSPELAPGFAKGEPGRGRDEGDSNGGNDE